MKHVLVLGTVWLASVGSAFAQPGERLEIAAIVRSDRVSFEGGQHARLPVVGAGISYRLWKSMQVEAEITTASGESSRSYEGDFISYAGPGATREELLRMAVIARRTTTNTPGVGFASSIAVETREPGRVNLAVRAGVSFRDYTVHDDMTVLRVPEGVTFEQAESALPDARGRRGRSGLLLGLGIPVRIAGGLRVAPEVRWVWGGPARVGNNYDEGAIGVRIAWKF
jgi:hypothetical protein